MRFKLNWGTGIFIFLVLFVSAAAGFIIFAFNQDVNLVHKDYYEKGVDYSEQMKIDARSVKFYNSIETKNINNQLILEMEQSMASEIDSGNVLFFRPSNSKLDIQLPLNINNNKMIILKDNLIPGRYILKLNWFSEGQKYEIRKPVNVQ